MAEAQDWWQGGESWIGGFPESWWCSARNPQPGCTASRPDVCYPVSADTPVPTQGMSNAVDVIKSIQRWANAFLEQAGKRLLYVDARVGPATVQAANSILGTTFARCDDLMASADWVSGELGSRGTNQGLTPPPDPAPRTPALVEKAEIANYRWAWWVIGGVVLVGAVAVGVSLVRRK